MKIMSRYMGASFLGNFLLAALSLTGLIALFSIFESIWIYFRFNPPFSLYLRMIASRVPWMALQAIPASLLVGAMATLAIMARNGEITALRASGIPVRKIALPFLTVALLVSSATFFLQERIVPDAYSRYREIKNVKIMAKPAEMLVRSTNVWLRKGDSMVNAKWISPDRKTLKDVKVFELNDSKIVRTIAAQSAAWDEGGWILTGATLNSPTASGWETARRDKMPYPIAPTPEDIYISKDEPPEMDMGELRLTIESLAAQGLSTSSLEVDWWTKTSAPFYGLVLTMIAIPFAVGITKRSGLWGAIAKGIGIGLFFYIVNILGISLGRMGALPPWGAAWLAPVLFAAMTFRLFARAESGR